MVRPAGTCLAVRKHRLGVRPHPVPERGTGAASLLLTLLRVMAGSILSSAGMLCFCLDATTQTVLSLPGKHHTCPSMKANGFSCTSPWTWSGGAQPARLSRRLPGVVRHALCPWAVVTGWTRTLLHVQRRKTALKIAKATTTFHSATTGPEEGSSYFEEDGNKLD